MPTPVFSRRARLDAGDQSWNPELVETNIVVAELTRMKAALFSEALRARAILANPVGPARIRFTTHKDISRADLEKALPQISDILKRSEA